MKQSLSSPCASRSGLGTEYLDLLQQRQTNPVELTRHVVADELVTVAYKGRFLASPVFLSAQERRSVASDLYQIYRLLTHLPERLFGGDTRAFARAVGMTEIQADIVQRAAAAGQPLLPLARSDLYRGADGFKLLELNITSALGGFENAGINQAMLMHPVLADFIEEHGLAHADTFGGIIKMLYAECAAHMDRTRRPVVALVDWPESFKSYEPRLNVMAALFDAAGIDAIPCHVGQITDRDGYLEVEGRSVDVLYRFFLVEEIETAADAEFVEPLLRAFEEGRVGMFSRFDSELYGNKGALAMLSDDHNRSAFTADEQACIDRFLPWTRHVRSSAVDPVGEEVDLVQYAVAHQEDLILKPTLLHGGNGIVPGWIVSPEEWLVSLTEAMDGPYVVQERIRPLPELFPADDGVGTQELFLNWGVFLTDPQVTGMDGYNGCLVRGSTNPNVGVVSMAGGARVACSFYETDSTTASA
ncbi:hypothetical protein [Streptomyces sp. NBC_01207]|uniref:hypothetical protein n=1 Tax=Streptomyces sp. NBC_01207 TaxID=2903772 RepID=UPI002E14D662|nr:hypothetical protein OG457_48870 [Streptomyces sp. NBC_01207]